VIGADDWDVEDGERLYAVKVGYLLTRFLSRRARSATRTETRGEARREGRRSRGARASIARCEEKDVDRAVRGRVIILPNGSFASISARKLVFPRVEPGSRRGPW